MKTSSARMVGLGMCWPILCSGERRTSFCGGDTTAPSSCCEFQLLPFDPKKLLLFLPAQPSCTASVLYMQRDDVEEADFLL